MEIFDITLTLNEKMPFWPGSIGYKRSNFLSIAKGDVANVSVIEMDVHTGTHLDAPSHFIAQGATVEQLNLHTLIGDALVLDMRGRAEISADDLADKLRNHSPCPRVLLRTDNSALWGKGDEFFPSFCALTTEAAHFVVDQKIALIGVDYLSVQKFSDPNNLTHEVLLKNKTIIIEGLNLSEIAEGMYMLHCLPIKLLGADGAPVRAVLSR